jgi:hypothetical protein
MLIHCYLISDEFLAFADEFCPSMPSVCYQSIYRKEPALGETSKRNPKNIIYFQCNIMLPVTRCLSVLSGHNTTHDTLRQFQRAQPCAVSADRTATTGWQPKHNTWLEGGADVNSGACSFINWSYDMHHRSPTSYHVPFESICYCWQEPGFEGHGLNAVLEFQLTK